MSKVDRGIVIVGAGLAGATAAATLRECGFPGRLTVLGDEHQWPYDRVPLSKQLICDEVGVEALRLPRADPSAADWRLGDPAVRLDLAGSRLQLSSGEWLDFDGLVVATGVRARSLPIARPRSGVFTIRTISDALALREAIRDGSPQVAVIGAGFVGTEVAASCRRHGLQTTLIDPLPTPLYRACGAQVGAVLAEVHRDHGVVVRTGSPVTALLGTHSVQAVALADATVVPADLVVLAVGSVPAVGWLADSGLAVTDGLRCDATLAAAPRVVAAGDLARWPSRWFGSELRVEHWDNAAAQGAAAARTLLAHLHGQPAEPFDEVPHVWSDQYGHRMQLLGAGQPGDELRVVVGSLESRRFVALRGRAGRVVGAVGMDSAAGVMRRMDLVRGGARWDEAIQLTTG
jgi:NADPH-dependent 2,4-dienoyl-CoA reductase/sulfur reductase-like enzyme